MNELGRRGEETARSFLERKGFHIICCNYRWSGGEIDVIAEQGSTLVCAEVKTWGSTPFHDLERSITGRKRRTIINTTRRFLEENPEYADYFVRYDLLFVKPDAEALEHIEDAFQETGAV